MKRLDRQTIIEWRARGIASPIDRLKFLREQVGPVWPEPRRRWLAPALAGAFTLVLISGVLLSAFDFHHPASVPLTGPLIIAPPIAVPLDSRTDSAVWLVDRKSDSETYSNGLRIENRYVVPNQARGRYRVFSRNDIDSAEERYLNQPSGIVFHTTESDQAPFQAGEDRNLKRIGQDVLLFVQRNRSYHFVVDRFGRVFRVVREEDVAYHSGNSVWADQDRVYLALNTSFLGIAIETQSRAGQDTASATAAQIYSVRVLTGMLRSKYRIAGSNCVTHAQVSINPANNLIGFHTDWAGNFPFQAAGLPDNYMQPPPSMVVFGFSYDTRYLSSTGARMLPGLLRADSEVQSQAARLGLDVTRYRALLRTKFTRVTSTKEKEGVNNGN